MDYEMMVKCAYEEIIGGIEKEAAAWAAPTPGAGFKHLNSTQQNLIKSYAFGKNIFERDSMANKLDAGIQKMQTKMKSFKPDTVSGAQRIANKYGQKIQNLENMKANILGTKPQNWVFD